MTDFLLLENIHKMIKEIPKPRLMFRKGITVRGFFRPYMSFSEYTSASIFNSNDNITPVIVRFSSMLGDNGTADTMRNIKSMNVKMKAEEGDYDIICQNIPVFFINEVEKVKEIISAFTVREKFDKINTKKFWEYVVNNPESLNSAVRLFSHQGITDSFINQKWYSVNNTIWKNGSNTRTWIRYNWIPLVEDQARREQENAVFNRTYAEFMAGFDPDRAFNEVERKIHEKKYPVFELCAQMIRNEDITETDLRYTLMWTENKAPSVTIGSMVLESFPDDINDHNTTNCAFGNTIDGIEVYMDEFMEVLNYFYKVEALERC